MFDTAAVQIADRPAVAFLATLVVAGAVYAAFQLAFADRVYVLKAGAFAIVFAAFLVGLASLRDRVRG